MIPSGWVGAQLSDLADVVMGQSPPGDTYSNDSSGTPFFQGKAEFGELYPTVRKYCSAPAKFAEAEDVLFSVRAPVGPTNLAPKHCCIGRGLAAIRPRGNIKSRFILYFFRSIEGWLSQQGTGTTFAAVSGEFLRALEVPLPPLREQKRIVAKIDSLQSRSKKAREALEAIPALIEKYRQSVLAAAFRGDLTREWRRKNEDKLEPATELLKRIRVERRKKWEETELAKMRAKGKKPKDDSWKTKYKDPAPVDTEGLPELPEGWCWASVEELVTEPLSNGRSVVDRNGGFPVLRLTALKNGRIDITESKEGAWTLKEAAPYLLKKGDFLVSRGNGSLRLLALGGLVKEETAMVAFPDTLIRFRLCSTINLDLFSLIWNSETIRTQIEARAHTTAGIHKVSQRDLGSIAIPVPGRKEQDILSGRIGSALKRIERIATVGKNLCEWNGGLDQSILSKAFRGELVPQDPNDEPASVLLERIRKEREEKEARNPKKMPKKQRERAQSPDCGPLSAV